MTDAPISVVIISYNARHYLESCLRQTTALHAPRTPEQPLDIVVVDNASNDGSPDLIQREFPTVRLLELEENLGFGAANNRGVALTTKSDFVLLLNSDAWLGQEDLDRLWQTITNNSHLAAVAPQLRYPDEQRQFTWVPSTGLIGEGLQKIRNRFEHQAWVHRLPPAWLRPFTIGDFWLTAACLLVRRQAFAEVGGFDEDFFLYFEDVDLCERWRWHQKWHLGWVPQATAYHVKGGSQSNHRGNLEYRRSQLRFYAKHRPSWEHRFLRRRLARRFKKARDPELRRQLLDLL